MLLSPLAEIVGNVGDLGAVFNLAAQFFQVLNDFGRREQNAALNGDRAGAGGHVFQTFAIDRFGQNGCGRGSVTGDIAGSLEATSRTI